MVAGKLSLARWSLGVLLLAMAVLPLVGSQRAEATNGWFNGVLVNSETVTCPFLTGSTVVLGIGTFGTYWADLNGQGNPSGNSPRVGDVFYTKVTVSAVGNGWSIVPTVRLPAGVSPAIDATNKLRCF